MVLAGPQLVPTENIQSLNLAFKDIKSLLAWGNKQLPPLKLDLSVSLLDSAGEGGRWGLNVRRLSLGIFFHGVSGWGRERFCVCLCFSTSPPSPYFSQFSFNRLLFIKPPPTIPLYPSNSLHHDLSQSGGGMVVFPL